VLLSQASLLKEADEFAKSVLTDEVLKSIVDLLPHEWLDWNDTDDSPAQIKEIYFQFLKTRRDHSVNFLNEASNARG